MGIAEEKSFEGRCILPTCNFYITYFLQAFQQASFSMRPLNIMILVVQITSNANRQEHVTMLRQGD